jgi:hypothetical protein
MCPLNISCRLRPKGTIFSIDSDPARDVRIYLQNFMWLTTVLLILAIY